MLLLCLAGVNCIRNECTQLESSTCPSCVSLNSANSFAANGCAWNQFQSACGDRQLNTPRVPGQLIYEDECPLTPTAEHFPELANWMGLIHSAIKDSPFLALSLPGTHDTLTYDLSLRTSDGGVDDMDAFAEVLHKYSAIVPNGIEDFIRTQAITQKLTITQQLDAGVRFLDFRVMQEYQDASKEWRSLHFVQSNALVLSYLKELKLWMTLHPSELVVLWMSKHGSECATGNDQYPNVSVDDKQAFWAEIVDLMDPVLMDHSVSTMSITPISTLLERSHRLAIYAVDYEEFTGGEQAPNGRFALDGCLIDNNLGPSFTNVADAKSWSEQQFGSAESHKTEDMPQQKLYLMSMAVGQPTQQIVTAARMRWGALNDSAADPTATSHSQQMALQRCIEAVGSPPGMLWCPPSLMDLSQLDNFYEQAFLEEAYQNSVADKPGWGFPHAIYLNGLTDSGGIRTGTAIPWGADRSEGASDEGVAHADAAYAYAPTMIAYNVHKACKSAVTTDKVHYKTCTALAAPYEALRKQFPLLQWDDEAYGRSRAYAEK